MSGKNAKRSEAHAYIMKKSFGTAARADKAGLVTRKSNGGRAKQPPWPWVKINAEGQQCDECARTAAYEHPMRGIRCLFHAQSRVAEEWGKE